jgi:diaminopimelate decarboxylase
VALRVNPNIDAHTHSYITTGLAENKFGISIEMLEAIVKRCVASPHIDLRGLHFHIGSQITQSDPFRMLCNVVNNLQDHYNAQGIYFPIINVGGGLGIDYDHPDTNPVPDFRTYFSMFHKHLRLRPGQELHFELGRSIVAQCGSLITKVLYVKQGLNKRFVIVDAGMTDLIRPALYQAHHTIQNLTSASGETAVYDVVGPICESSDVFGKDEQLPVTTRGDLLALRSAGAYGEIMASRYNCRELPASVCS